MSAIRLSAIGVILILASFAWVVLGGTVVERTDSAGTSMGEAVEGLWGTPQEQNVPRFKVSDGTSSKDLMLAGSDITADFKLDQRRKGLMWYSTYVVDFAATYRVSNPTTSATQATMYFTFPDPRGIYDGFAVRVGGREVPVSYTGDGQASAKFEVKPGATAELATGYRTNGVDRWSYVPSPEGAGIVNDMQLALTTDFERIDYPADGVSPTKRERTGDGWRLAWDYDSVVVGKPFGIVMPTPINPGPLVSRITFFAPVSLLFFFAGLVLITTTSGVRLHPMHYGFLAAAFFAFHLLLAYLADQIDVNAAFAVGSVTSVALVLGYLRAVIGRSRALVEIAVGQVVFLVLFSYSFFFEGFTGLAVTIGSVLTLAFFMARTAGVDWDSVFAKPAPAATMTAPSWAPPAPPAPGGPGA